MGAGGLIAATAASFVLVDRLARGIGYQPRPEVSVLATPGRYAVRFSSMQVLRVGYRLSAVLRFVVQRCDWQWT